MVLPALASPLHLSSSSRKRSREEATAGDGATASPAQAATALPHVASAAATASPVLSSPVGPQPLQANGDGPPHSKRQALAPVGVPGPSPDSVIKEEPMLEAAAAADLAE